MSALIVEQYCEPTHAMCLFDHAIENATSYFTKHNIGKPSYFK
jgi:hypothetical protein